MTFGRHLWGKARRRGLWLSRTAAIRMEATFVRCAHFHRHFTWRDA